MNILLFSLMFCLFSASVFGASSDPLLLIAVFIIHETGHYTASKIAGVRTVCVRGSLFGLRIRYDFSSVGIAREVAVCAAGPLFGLASALPFILSGLYRTEPFGYFTVSSLALSAVNLLPVTGLDGGSILDAVLEEYFLPDRAYRIMRAVSTVFALLFWLLTVGIQLKVNGNISMLLLSLYFLYRSLL